MVSPLSLPARRHCIVLLAFAVTACVPIPAPHTAQVAPAVTGQVRLLPGSPSGALALAVTVGSKDSLCAQPVTRTVTDAEGVFHLPRGFRHRSVYWLTMMEGAAGNSIWLCASGDPTDSVHFQARTYLPRVREGDKIECISWHWEEVPRLACNTPEVTRVLRGGTWAAGTTHGSCQIVLVDADPWGSRCRAYVHWIPSSNTESDTVTPVIRELTAASGLRCEWRAPYLLRDVSPDAPPRWQVTLTGAGLKAWGRIRYLRFILGAPGEVIQAEDS